MFRINRPHSTKIQMSIRRNYKEDRGEITSRRYANGAELSSVGVQPSPATAHGDSSTGGGQGFSCESKLWWWRAPREEEERKEGSLSMGRERFAWQGRMKSICWWCSFLNFYFLGNSFLIFASSILDGVSKMKLGHVNGPQLIVLDMRTSLHNWEISLTNNIQVSN